MNPPRFSVIIPAYNAESFIARAIESVLTQTWSAHGIIVIDDGSSDGTTKAFEKYEGCGRYLRQDNASAKPP